MANLFNGARHLLPVSERDSLEKGLIKMKARREGKLPSLVRKLLHVLCFFPDKNGKQQRFDGEPVTYFLPVKEEIKEELLTPK